MVGFGFCKCSHFDAKKSPSFSIPAGLEVLYMEEPDDDFLKLILLNLFASLIMALLVTVNVMFIQENLVKGFVSKKNFSSYNFVETALTMSRLCGFQKSIFEYILHHRTPVLAKKHACMVPS